MVEEAGAICIKDGHVLLIRSNKAPYTWLFPKGHIETGELPESCAVRELEEETGSIGYVLRKVGPLVFERSGAQYNVQYFLVKAVGDIKPPENRKYFWCPLEEAFNILTFPDSKLLLSEAVFGGTAAVEK